MSRPLAPEQHAALRRAERYLEEGIVALEDPTADAARMGFIELQMRSALVALRHIECPPRIDVERTIDRIARKSPPPLLTPPLVDGSLNIEPEAA